MLLLALVVVSIATRSRAQPTQEIPRARGEYTLLSPKTSDGSTGAVVVFDSVNAEMAALEWDKTRRQLVVTDLRDLNLDSAEQIGR